MMNILLVEDNLNDAKLIQEALNETLSESFKVHHVVRVREAIHFLNRHRTVSVILSDISLPDANGSETFQALHQAAANVPVIFMTSSHDTDLALDALKQGAQDYLIKGEYSNQFLARVIRFAIERKKYQKEVSAARAKTKALRQEARLLRQEQEQLTVLSKAKDDFISLASHQLRTPATGVKQYVGMMLEGFAGHVPKHLLPFLEKAYESNERQLSIVNDLLRIAQLDAGNIVLRREPTNLTAMLKNIASEQFSKFKERQQDLIFRPEGEDAILSVDADRMHMVFDNLIDNASKYTTEKHSVTIDIVNNVKTVVIRVKDQGVGIATEDISKMFDKFSRVANSRSLLVGGSGLGLYWVKRIVDLHEGTIKVRSKIGVGSEFIISLQK